jgi:hypothetical protein
MYMLICVCILMSVVHTITCAYVFLRCIFGQMHVSACIMRLSTFLHVSYCIFMYCMYLYVLNVYARMLFIFVLFVYVLHVSAQTSTLTAIISAITWQNDLLLGREHAGPTQGSSDPWAGAHQV